MATTSDNIIANRVALLKAVDATGPLDFKELLKIYSVLAWLHEGGKPETRNYAVIRSYLVIISQLHKDITGYPACLGDSEEIVPEEFPFPTEGFCDLFAECFERLGNVSGLVSYYNDRLAHLQSIWEVNGKKSEDADRLKIWRDKAYQSRDKHTQVLMEGQDKIVTQSRKWKTAQIRALPPGAAPEILHKINQEAGEMEAKALEALNKSLGQEYFPFEHPLTVDELSTDPVQLMALRLASTRLECNAHKARDLLMLGPLVYDTVCAEACNWCGAYVNEQKSLLCEGPCGGAFKGSYCGVDCRKKDSAIHAVYCAPMTPAMRSCIDNGRRLLQTKQGSALNVLSFHLYLRTVAMTRSANKSPADYAILNEVIRSGLECKDQPADLNALNQAYQSALQVCRINPFDPRHDFYIHCGLILGIRKLVIPVYGDRELKPLLVNPRFTAMTVAQHKAIGAALYPELVFAKPSCNPNVELVSGFAKSGEAPVPRLVVLRDIPQGEPLSFSYSSRVMMNLEDRDQDNTTRRIYCDCDLCEAQKTLHPDTQIEAMKRSLIAAYRAEKQRDIQFEAMTKDLVAVEEKN